MNEKDLIAKLLVNDEDAFRVLMDQHETHLYKVCMGFLHSKEEAEDVVQDVFVEVFKSIQYFKQTSALGTWLYRIAVNKCLNQVKRNKVKQLFLTFKEIVGAEDAVDVLEQKEQKSELTKAIGSLPENQRIAFTLAKYDELSYEEIATVMNVSVAAVESLMFRAKGNLKKRLQKYYDSYF